MKVLTLDRILDMPIFDYLDRLAAWGTPRMWGCDYKLMQWFLALGCRQTSGLSKLLIEHQLPCLSSDVIMS